MSGRPVSPELALVDPELARSARAALAPPGDCLAPGPRLGRPAPAPVEAFPQDGWARPSLGVAVGALVVAALVGTPTISPDTFSAAAGAVAHALHLARAAATP